MLSTAQVADDSRLEFSLFLISEFSFATSLGRGEPGNEATALHRHD